MIDSPTLPSKVNAAVLQSNCRSAVLPLVLAPLFLVMLLAFTSPSFAQTEYGHFEDSSFRDFRSAAPSPSELIKALSQNSGLKIAESPNQALQQRLKNLFNDLSPEQQKGMLDLGKRYVDRQKREGNSVKLPEDLKKLATPEMRRQIRDQFSEKELGQFRDILEDINQAEIS